MENLNYASARELAELIRDKKVSSEEVVGAYLRRIDEVNPKINAFVHLDPERALTRAREADRALARGDVLGSLHGVPVSIKDSIETAGVRTTSGSRLFESFVPERDAPSVARLKNAGAVILGKTNVPELALDYRSENVLFGRTSNPWDLSRTPGGSSGGEAAAIAAGCSAAGIGSDLGGSIRVPAHFCGITGLKPTPGRIPGSGHLLPGVGVFGLGNSIGPLARRVEDLSLMLEVLAGFDPSDPVSVPIPARDPGAVDVRKLRVMWYADDGVTPVTEATRRTVEQAAQALAERGLEVVERKPVGIERAHDLWFWWLGQSGLPGILALHEGREELMGPLMRGLKAIGRPLSFEKFLSVWVERDRLRASVLSEMTEFPIILAPVAAMPAFPHDHRGNFDIEGEQVEYLRMFGHAQSFNLLGLPGAVVPCGTSPEGLPIGVQSVGRPFAEEETLAVAAVLEEAFGGYRPPAL